MRGEDSLVRALWAGAPFVWQLYPQHDGAHLRKLQAFLARWRADSPAAPPAASMRGSTWPGTRLASPLTPARCRRWRPGATRCTAGVNISLRRADLCTRLLGFVAGKR